MQSGGDKRRDGEAMSKCHGQNIVPGRFDRADSDKNQSECSDEFSEAGTKLIHAAMQSDCIDPDNALLKGHALSCPNIRAPTARRLHLTAGVIRISFV